MCNTCVCSGDAAKAMQLGEHSGNRFKLVLRPVDTSSVNGSSGSASGSSTKQRDSVQAAVAELSQTG